MVGDLTQDYRTMLLRFLPRQDEAARAAAYELGRRAFSAGMSLLRAIARDKQEEGRNGQDGGWGPTSRHAVPP